MRVRVLGREAITEYCGSVSSWVISDVFVSRFHARRFSVIIDRNEIQPYMLLDIKRLRYLTYSSVQAEIVRYMKRNKIPSLPQHRPQILSPLPSIQTPAHPILLHITLLRSSPPLAPTPSHSPMPRTPTIIHLPHLFLISLTLIVHLLRLPTRKSTNERPNCSGNPISIMTPRPSPPSSLLLPNLLRSQPPGQCTCQRGTPLLRL